MANIFNQPTLVNEADRSEGLMYEERVYQELQEQYRQELEDDQGPRQHRLKHELAQQWLGATQAETTKAVRKGSRTKSKRKAKGSRYATQQS